MCGTGTAGQAGRKHLSRMRSDLELSDRHIADVYRLADSPGADRRLRCTRPRLLLHLPQTHQPDADV